MSNTLKIKIPEGFEIDSFEASTGEIKFKAIPLDIMERIISFDDVCREMGKNPKNYICTSDDPDDIAANALKQALLISRCFNAVKKEVMDWGNSNQRKHVLVYYYSPSSGWSLFNVAAWVTSTDCGSRRALRTRDVGRYLWENFSDLIKETL